MTNKEILEKAIEKAKNNGWNDSELSDQLEFGCSFQNDLYINFHIFSHDFAKAFWGECTDLKCKGCFKDLNWKYHLQQMVLEEEPLKYLEQFLDE